MIHWKNGEIQFEGAVLAHPVYHAAAFSRDWEEIYATVWDGKRVKDVVVGIAAYANGTSDVKAITVGLSPETEVAVAAYRTKFAFLNSRIEAAEATIKQLVGLLPGSIVRVVKGRKVPLGDYVVQRTGENGYGKWVQLENGQYTARDNVRPVVPAREYGEAVTNYFAARAARDQFHAETGREDPYLTPDFAESYLKGNLLGWVEPIPVELPGCDLEA